MKNQTIESVKQFIRHPYAWPGGYPLILVMNDGGTLCRLCAQKEFKLIVDSTKTHRRDGWQAEGIDVYYEGAPIHCDNCGSVTESAYGDPEEANNE